MQCCAAPCSESAVMPLLQPFPSWPACLPACLLRRAFNFLVRNRWDTQARMHQLTELPILFRSSQKVGGGRLVSGPGLPAWLPGMLLCAWCRLWDGLPARLCLALEEAWDYSAHGLLSFCARADLRSPALPYRMRCCPRGRCVRSSMCTRSSPGASPAFQVSWVWGCRLG